MSQLTSAKIMKALYGLLSGLDSTDEALIKRVLGVQWKEKVALTDGGTAATAVAATPFYTNDEGTSVRVVNAKLITPVTVAPGATDNMTLTLSKVDSEGSNAATVATYTSNVAGGTATADVPKSLTNTDANVVVASGWTLRAAVTKGASGVAFAEATAPAYLVVTLEKVST